MPMDSTISRVEVRFPGQPSYLRLARLATADAGSRAGLSIDEIEDLRIAVSELCALVGGEDVELTLAFTTADGSVEVDGRGGPGLPEGENADMAQALVAAVVDEHRIQVDAAHTTFQIVKRAH
jgi:hypothetical protein